VVKILEMQWLDTAKMTVRRVRKMERDGLQRKGGRRISEERWRVEGSKSRGGRREIKGRRENERGRE
jgi:hypothetical protein